MNVLDVKSDVEAPSDLRMTIVMFTLALASIVYVALRTREKTRKPEVNSEVLRAKRLQALGGAGGISSAAPTPQKPPPVAHARLEAAPSPAPKLEQAVPAPKLEPVSPAPSPKAPAPAPKARAPAPKAPAPPARNPASPQAPKKVSSVQAPVSSLMPPPQELGAALVTIFGDAALAEDIDALLIREDRVTEHVMGRLSSSLVEKLVADNWLGKAHAAWSAAQRAHKRLADGANLTAKEDSDVWKIVFRVLDVASCRLAHHAALRLTTSEDASVLLVELGHGAVTPAFVAAMLDSAAGPAAEPTADGLLSVIEQRASPAGSLTRPARDSEVHPEDGGARGDAGLNTKLLQIMLEQLRGGGDTIDAAQAHLAAAFLTTYYLQLTTY